MKNTPTRTVVPAARQEGADSADPVEVAAESSDVVEEPAAPPAAVVSPPRSIAKPVRQAPAVTKEPDVDDIQAEIDAILREGALLRARLQEKQAQRYQLACAQLTDDAADHQRLQLRSNMDRRDKQEQAALSGSSPAAALSPLDHGLGRRTREARKQRNV